MTIHIVTAADIARNNPEGVTLENTRLYKREIAHLETYDETTNVQAWLGTDGKRHRRGYPRTQQQKEDRMDKMVDWKRRKLRERWLMHTGLIVGIGICGPLFIGLCVRLWAWGFGLISVIWN